MEKATAILGKEYDTQLREALFVVLRDLHAKLVSREQGVAGSQDLEVMCFDVDGALLVVESETYMGLSVQGQKSLALLVQSRVHEKLSR